jgi:hypothetical protein
VEKRGGVVFVRNSVCVGVWVVVVDCWLECRGLFGGM